MNYKAIHKASGRYGVLTPNNEWLGGFLGPQKEAEDLANKLNCSLNYDPLTNFTDLKIETLKLAEQLLELGLIYKLESHVANGFSFFDLRIFTDQGEIVEKFTATTSTVNDDHYTEFLNRVRKYINDKKNNFYLVWSPSGDSPPKHKHYTFESAQKEAKRLASIVPQANFYVLENKSVYPDVIDNDGIPF